eukprot:2389236-Rhodomonas_salina.1
MTACWFSSRFPDFLPRNVAAYRAFATNYRVSMEQGRGKHTCSPTMEKIGWEGAMSRSDANMPGGKAAHISTRHSLPQTDRPAD